MLSAPIKNRKRRRRRRKQSISAVSSAAIVSSSHEADDSPAHENERTHAPQPRVTSEFLNEEALVETAILVRRFNRDTDTELERKTERGIEFFTSHIEWDETTVADDDIHEDKDDAATYPDDGPQLASSYLNEDVANVIEPFGRQTIEYDTGNLFIPSMQMSKEWTNDVESDATAHRNLVDEGHFVPAPPKIALRNRSQFIHRLLASGTVNPDLTNFTNFTAPNSDLTKSMCAREFHAIHYEPTTALAANVFGLQNKILKLQINDMSFDRHPLFNNEQKLARELEKLYNEYKVRQQTHLTADIQNKLDVLRQHMKNTSMPRSNQSSSRDKTTGDDGDDDGERLRAYRDELRDLRNRVYREMKIDRDIVVAILSKWAELKKERETHAAVTTLRLIIRTEETDAERDTFEWTARFNLEFNEIFHEAMDFYRQERRRHKQQANESAKDDIETANEFEAIAKLHRPDAESIRQQLFDIFSNSIRPPGEQLVHFELDFGDRAQVTSASKDRPKYVVRLLFDGKELDCAVSSVLNKHGQAHVDAAFCVKFITKIPEKLNVQIYEKYPLKVEKKVTEIFQPIPYADEIFANATVSPICFASPTESYAGSIACKIGWKESTTETATTTAAAVTTARSTIDTEMRSTVEKWYEQRLIDPMDPENGTMAPIIAEMTASTPHHQRQSTPQHTESDSKLFRLNEEVHTFCPLNKFNANKRLELLTARFNSDLKLKDCRLVPHAEIEIEVPSELNIFEDMLWIDPIDVQRYQGKKYLKHVYDIITNHCMVINRNYEHQDILIGDTPPTLNGALEAFANIFSPRRPLNPTRRTSSSMLRRSNLNDSDRINRFNIIVNVVRASNIPFRSRPERTTHSSSTRRSSLASTAQNFHRQANVRPFVTATFKQRTLRTSTVDGSNPTWNEQIVIPISEDINQIKDSLWFHMYDEIIEDIPSNDELVIPATEIYQKISSHYLGELIIPFSTIFASQRIEGTFEMMTPVILFGYTKPAVTLKENLIDPSAGTIEVRRSILISLLISIEPIIDVVQFSTTHLECIELMRVKNHIRSWLVDFRDEFPQRAKDPLVCMASGKRVCITRLIGPIDIPFERNDVSEYLIRRFVSLVPVRPHKNVCTKLNGVWLTNDQMLSILIASPKDLGVLLTCYYLSLGFNAYLVMGFAIPYGDTTFVLTKENGEYYLIDPHSGKKCSSRDTFCPLTKVYCVVGADNVWANIQREHRVYMQSFDLTQSMEWRALFTKSIPAPNDTMHDLKFEYTDSLDANSLRKSIETKLMRKIGVWRTSARKTVWNRRYREQLTQILQELEEDRCFEYEQKSYTDKLNGDLLSKYKLSGYPLNMPYVSIARVIERVKATGLHFNSDQRVEFALAVHIQSYPMNIFSVWIFLLALIPH